MVIEEEEEVMVRGVVGRFAGVVWTLRGGSRGLLEVIAVPLLVWSRKSDGSNFRV